MCRQGASSACCWSRSAPPKGCVEPTQSSTTRWCGRALACTLARPAPPARMRTLMLTDLAWARAARAATLKGLADMRPPPDAIVYSSTTAALLWPRPGAIRFDAPSAGNRRGRHGLWQRPLERRRLAQAPVLLPWSEACTARGPAHGGARRSRARRAGARRVLVAREERPAGRGAATRARHPRHHLRRQPFQEGSRPRAGRLAADT